MPNLRKGPLMRISLLLLLFLVSVSFADNWTQFRGENGGKLTNIESFFQFYMNEITGTIPTELGKMTRLREIAMSVNKLSGDIPSELGLLSNLSSLFLAANQLTGTVPSELAQLPALEFMFLQGNELNGDLKPFCDRPNWLDQLGADCVAEVQCTCCTYCCDERELCQEVF